MSEPEVDNIVIVDRSESIDVDMLTLVQNQFLCNAVMLDAIPQTPDISWLNVPVIETVNHEDISGDVFEIFMIISSVPEGVVITSCSILSLIDFFNLLIPSIFNIVEVTRLKTTTEGFFS